MAFQIVDDLFDYLSDPEVAGKPVGYLVTKSSFENYQLHAEWRWPAGSRAPSPCT